MKRQNRLRGGERLEARRVLASFSFSPPERVASYDGDVAMIRPADLDNDGDEDIVFLDVADSSIHVIENIGYGKRFGDPYLLGVVPDAYEFEIVDMDNDNDLDVVTARISLVVFENHTLDTLDFRRVDRALDVAGRVHSFRIADWDSDGDHDVIASHNEPFSSERVFDLPRR